MIRTAASAKPRTAPVARSRPLPAPVGGLNARDAIAAMPESDALVLDNWFPGPNSVSIRRGHESFATNVSSLSFTRASSATYVDSTGVIQTATTDVPRYTYDPTTLSGPTLLIESAATALAMQSEAFGSWSNISTPVVSSNAAVAPDGNTTADTITDDNVLAEEGKDKSAAISSSSDAYVFSIFVKKSGSAPSIVPRIVCYFTGGTGKQVDASINCFTGGVGYDTTGLGVAPTSIAAVEYNDYWRLVVIMSDNGTGNTAAGMNVFPASYNSLTGGTASGYATSYTGDLTVWGAMVCKGSAVSSYVATTTSNVTRAADGETYTATGDVESLMTWTGPSSAKLFAAGNGSIVNVTSGGNVTPATTLPDLYGLTGNRWQHTMQTTSGGNFLICCNGADSVRSYDGSAWATPSISGVTSSTLVNVAVHKRRVWFVEKDTTKAWYLGADAISGTATAFNLGPLFSLGGKLIAIGSMTRDGGNGPDDLACFISSRGEVAVYQGTDPASTETWAIVGVFQISPPIGYRCLRKLGGDLAVITETGVVSLSASYVLDRAAGRKAAVTDKINNLFVPDARTYNSSFGWQVISYPRGTMFIVNIPTATTARQYVMNTLTGAWCRFTGLDAACWEVFNEDLYFGGPAGEVFKADTGYQDDGGAIQADMKPAFSYFGQPGRLKNFTMARPLFESNGLPGYLMGLNVDFEDAEPTSTPSPTEITGSVWDTAVWDTDVWGGGNQITKNWQGIAGSGHSAALRLRVNTNGAEVTLHGFDVMYETGGQM